MASNHPSRKRALQIPTNSINGLGRANAPQGDQVFWQKLSGVLDGISSGNNDAAVALLQDLAKAADTKDYALVSALRKLAEKIKAAG